LSILTKAVLEPAVIDVDAPTAYETFSSGLETAKLRDSLELEVHGKNTFFARDWRRKYEKKFGKKEA
jgi:hypothetical protein